ncbi:exopolyphosphatase/guanosine-5'-triphosphate,3'-diphosphate pyrophosphatase [Barrientosiimonas humi]|uniref:Exopolyphosphatase/guanosine-5'-triphosphate, 3'-diphosphate pyrophosphatase n=1 Tax=Barrientosiimonas humi TaxID=999931 RepID=A0A542X831_9MICO|nr:Ppx/GppA phosphatase family protein [Barrientosiimonas humi]TQL31985.1 exopolyphosphatase/guanosine-5'-triphosphate,3'-diphosphate pyrophosphatase [Barrientosiimonas humi]CAG7571860.1 Guanosine-5'-triphosphate,3'-diphosphate pyrophosphatase [Barrientosiimonas humi]
MRLGVIDVGSNTVHLLVVDAHRGARPFPAFSHKIALRLSEHTKDDGRIAGEGVKRLVSFVGECLTIAEDEGIEDLLAFATSAIREAPNGEAVLQQVRDETGADLQVLSGADEARLTFLAARRWFGWSSGRLLCVDIGGGSLELATGIDEEPDAAISLPLGAGRMSRELPGNPPSRDDVRSLRKQVRSDIARIVRDLNRFGSPDHVVGTSKTIRSLARVLGAAPSAEGPYVPRRLVRSELADLVPRLATMTVEERAALPGVSAGRAHQLLAGAVVVESAMHLLDVEQLDLCPWALREGVILRRLDWLEA